MKYIWVTKVVNIKVYLHPFTLRLFLADKSGFDNNNKLACFYLTYFFLHYKREMSETETQLVINQLITENEQLRIKLDEARAEIAQLKFQQMKDNRDIEEYESLYEQARQDNKLLTKQNEILDQQVTMLKEQIKMMKDKYEPKTLEGFMKQNGKIMDRADTKVIKKELQKQGIGCGPLKQLQTDLQNLGYIITVQNKNGVDAYVCKDATMIFYLAQLKKHEGTNIYKYGRTINLRSRKQTYKKSNNGDVSFIKTELVTNGFEAEKKMKERLEQQVKDGKAKRNEEGDEYYNISINIMEQLYNEVVSELGVKE